MIAIISEFHSFSAFASFKRIKKRSTDQCQPLTADHNQGSPLLPRLYDADLKALVAWSNFPML